MRRPLLPALTALAVLAPAASAIAPVIQYRLGTGESGGVMAVGGADILKGATVPQNFKCVKKNAVVPKAIPVKAQGSFATFSYKGKLKGQKGKLSFSGRFHNGPGERVTGKTKITKGKCVDKRSWSGDVVTEG